MLSQRTLSLEVRDFKPADYERLVEVFNANFPDYTRSVAETRSRDESLDTTKYHLKRYSFVDKNTASIVGFGEVAHITDMYHPNKFALNMFIEPKRHGQGIGRAVYQRLTDHLKSLDAVTAWVQVKEDLPQQIGFFQRRGFKESMRVWESRLPVSSVNTAQFKEYPAKVASRGITISTLGEERAIDPHATKKLHEVVQSIAEDIPQPAPYTRISYDQWEAFELKNPSLLPDGYFIAKDGDRYVGLSVVWKSDTEPKSLYQGNTGVIREYRGRGVAVALKLRVIEYAREHGYEKVKTWNATNNAAMLAVNTKLGFKRQIGWIFLEKDLA
jgi:GNAT superfamily N-acetyltransferase